MALDPVAQCRRNMRESLVGFAKANDAIAQINQEYAGMIGKAHYGSHELSYEEARIMRKADQRRKEAIGDREYYMSEATMWGMAALVEMDDPS